MTNTPLQAELLSLVQHVELNKSGWWEKTIQRLIVTVVWLSEKTLTESGIVAEFRKVLGVNIQLAVIKQQVEELVRSNGLVRLPTGQLKVAEQNLRQLERELNETESILDGVRRSFDECMVRHCPDLTCGDDLWRNFNDELLTPLIKELGVRTYDLISRSRPRSDSIPRFAEFSASFPLDTRRRLREGILEFLDPQNALLRAYVIRHLNAYFFLEASSLKKQTLEVLTKAMQTKPSFHILVDTNFLFSILSLHDNPSNEAAVSLVKLIEQIKDLVEVKLFVFPLTIDEATLVLTSARTNLGGLVLPANLAEAALDVNISGMTRRFAEVSSHSEVPISAEDYFNPYIVGLLRVIQQKGILLLDEDVQQLRTAPVVITDIDELYDYHSNKRDGRSKGYEAIEHDVVLWHFVKSKRPVRVDSPVDAKYWITTIDYSLLGFDSSKRRQEPSNSIPVCLHPTALIQMLQFWVPRTRELEEAVLSSLRLPFFFQAFDPVDESTTVKILKTVARFENVEDISPDTASAVLMNQALRDRIENERDPARQQELVREAVIVQDAALRNDLQIARNEAIRERSEKVAAQQRLQNQQDQMQNLEQRMERESSSRQELEIDLNQLKESEHSRTVREQRTRATRRFLILWVGIPIALIWLLGLALSVALTSLRQNVGNGIWTLLVVCFSIVLFVAYFFMVDRRGANDDTIKDWPPFSRFHRLNKWVLGVFGAVVLGILTNAVYDWIISLWHGP